VFAVLVEYDLVNIVVVVDIVGIVDTAVDKAYTVHIVVDTVAGIRILGSAEVSVENLALDKDCCVDSEMRFGFVDKDVAGHLDKVVDLADEVADLGDEWMSLALQFRVEVLVVKPYLGEFPQSQQKGNWTERLRMLHMLQIYERDS